MKRTHWRPRIGIAAAICLLGLHGCPSPPGPAGGPAPTAPGGATFRTAVVVDTGGIDDKSFNAAANEGRMRAQAELGLTDQTASLMQSKAKADYKTNLNLFASQGYDLVIAVGQNMEDALKEVAPQFPNAKFAIVDGSVPEGAANCASLKFREEQGTFLAGFLAASMSKTKKIGFVGGEEIDLIKKFEAGYRAGAKAAGFNPDTQVVRAYTNNWDDVNKGRNIAEQEFGNGVDIIFAAAGKGGLGVIEAAKAKGPGFYAIGVDQDQDGLAPGRVLTSMVKHVDTAVYDTIKRAKEHKFEAGTVMYDLKQGGVDLSEMKYTKQDVPAEVTAKLQKLRAMIADGSVVPPTTLEAVKDFHPPAL
jgi:basic membrane protein A